MKNYRLKSALCIFNQCIKKKNIPSVAHFDADVVDFSELDDNGRYYGGILFIPSVASNYSKYGRPTATADAAVAMVSGLNPTVLHSR